MEARMRDTAGLFKALGDETRLQMLWLLMNRRELCVCDLMEALGVTQSKASRHLRYLYHAGLVNDRREGLWVHYSLRPASDPLVRGLLRALRSSMAASPQAPDLLASLEAWLQRKGCRACAP
jgi:ArsR family transcriptional regulator